MPSLTFIFISPSNYSFHISSSSSTTSFSFLMLEGVCEVGGTLADGGAALVIADIPGLVEGAHMVPSAISDSDSDSSP